ncbi:MAG: T9SS type A sorting domain-containing protein [Parafilimonas sp.]
MKTILCSFIFLLIGVCLTAQPGTLDSSFGVNGKVKTSPLKYSLQCSAVAPQSDGSIIATGTINSMGFFATKYSSNGIIDSSFGINGLVSINKIGEALSMAIQPDNKILVGGYYAYMFSPYYVSIARFNANGTIDSSFGNNGNLFISGETRCTAIALQSDNKILIEGDDNKQNVLTMRLFPNGKIDSTFGINGVAPNFYGLGNTIAIQKDGKIVIGGRTDTRLFFARYSTNGTFDSSFGTDGRIFYDFATGPDIVHDLVLQADNKIVAIASTSSYWGDTINQVVLRCMQDGSLDQSFGDGGLNKQNFANQQDLRSVVLQKDGKIIICGSISLTANTGGFLLKRYSTNGLPDSTFGNNGFTTTAFDTITTAFSVFLQNDDKIVLGGLTQTLEYQQGIALARYNNNSTKRQIIINKIKHYISTHNNADAATFYKNINLYPNPVKDILTINGLDTKTNYTLSIINNKGNVVATKQVNNLSSYQFNVQNVSSGVYYVNVVANNKLIATLKFVKQ